MKVAIDTGPLTSGDSVRGVGEYTRQLISSLRKLQSKDLELVEVPTEKLNETEADVVHVPYFSTFKKTVPVVNHSKLVLSIHDVIPLIYPKYYPLGFKGNLNLQIQKFRLRQVDAVITDSITSKKDLVRFLGIRPEIIYPIYLDAADHFKKLKSNNPILKKTKRKYHLPDEFVLYVGDVNYNKNLPRLLKARKKANFKLVIVGKQALEVDDVGISLINIQGPRDWIRFLTGRPHPELAHYAKLNKYFKSKHVIRPGYVSNEELVAIYNLATVYVQPSLYEGFGIPVLEAMNCGTAVIASKTQCLYEISEGVCMFFNSKDADEAARKIKRLLDNSDLRKGYIEKGKSHTQNFDWDKTAKETLEVYRKVTSEK